MEYNHPTGRYLLLHNTVIRAPPAETGIGQSGSHSLKFSPSLQSQKSPQSLQFPGISEPENSDESGTDEPATTAGWIAGLHPGIPDRLRKKIAGFNRRILTFRERGCSR